MVLTHTNRRGDTYYLHQGLTKKGNPKYFFSRQKDGKLPERIPEGYETYENPNGLVFLRRARPKIFSDRELAIVENGIRKYTDLKFYKIDVKANAIVISLPLQDVDAIRELVCLYSFRAPEEITRMLHKMTTFAPEMQLILTDKEKRLFSLERYCYRGRGHWMTLATSSYLRTLVKTYLKHLNKASFFDLLPEFHARLRARPNR